MGCCWSDIGELRPESTVRAPEQWIRASRRLHETGSVGSRRWSLAHGATAPSLDRANDERPQVRKRGWDESLVKGSRMWNQLSRACV